MTDENGKPTEDTARSTSYRYEGCGRLDRAFLDHFPERPLNFIPLDRARGLARIEDDIPLGSDFRTMQSKCLAKSPLNPVAHHGLSNRPRNGNAQARRSSTGVRPRQAKRGEQRPRETHSFVINGSEFGGAQEAGGSRPIEKLGRSATTSGVRSERRERLVHHLPSTCDGPGRAGVPAPPVHLCSSCARETRAFSRACDYSAEMYVSASCGFPSKRAQRDLRRRPLNKAEYNLNQRRPK
jgi:hypothetical protein